MEYNKLTQEVKKIMADERLLYISEANIEDHKGNNRIDVILFSTYEIVNEERVKTVDSKIKVKVNIPMDEITDEDRERVKGWIQYFREWFQKRVREYPNPETVAKIEAEQKDKEAKTYKYNRIEYGGKYKHIVDINKKYYKKQFNSCQVKLVLSIGFHPTGYGMSQITEEDKGDRVLITWKSSQSCE